MAFRMVRLTDVPTRLFRTDIPTSERYAAEAGVPGGFRDSVASSSFHVTFSPEIPTRSENDSRLLSGLRSRPVVSVRSDRYSFQRHGSRSSTLLIL